MATRRKPERCSDCSHPLVDAKAQRPDWTPCDEKCSHGGPVRVTRNGIPSVIPVLGGELPKKAGQLARHKRLDVAAGRRERSQSSPELCTRCAVAANRDEQPGA